MSISKNLAQHLQVFCQEIGPRPTGSAANQTAVRYAAEVFQQLGFQVTLQEFPCSNWLNNGAQLTVDGITLEVAAAEYSQPCLTTAPLVCVENITQLQQADMQGKICVLYGELCQEPLMPKSMTFWNPPEHKLIIETLEKQQPAAVITVSFLADTPVPIIQDGDFDIPCAAVKGALLPALLQGTAATLKLATQRQPAIAANLVATLGHGRKVALCAHIDTKPTTPGALDNGSGCAVLLALAAEVAKTKQPWQYEITLFNGEDYYSMPGEMLFMDTKLQQPQEYLLAVNIDGVGMQNSTAAFSCYQCPAELQQALIDSAADLRWDQITAGAPWPQGDHMLYVNAGIPAIAMTSADIADLMEGVMHTPKDNLDILDLHQLEQTVAFWQHWLQKAPLLPA